ncbi:MAG: hypothetical protein AAFV53_28380 [Myxococcota bacterium]
MTHRSLTLLWGPLLSCVTLLFATLAPMTPEPMTPELMTPELMTPEPMTPSSPGTPLKMQTDFERQPFGSLRTAARCLDGTCWIEKGDGVGLMRLNPGHVIAQIGLQVGDTVTAIDQHPVETLEDLATFAEGIRPELGYTLTLDRRGQPVFLQINVEGPHRGWECGTSAR